MATPCTAKMSSKGQVVIPEEIRERMKLSQGARFFVMGENDVVILKTIMPPAMDKFTSIIKKARKQAKEAGMRSKDIDAAIRKARKSK